MRSALASVKAPLTWPNSSLSNTPSPRAPALTAMNGFWARSEAACSQRATTSLPVPCSPVISTLASDGATRSKIRRTCSIAREPAIRGGSSPPAARRSFSPASLPERRRARASSIWVRRVVSRRALSHGFWM